MKADRLEKAGKGLWLFCLVMGTILLLAASGVRVPAVGFALTGTACFWRRREARQVLSFLKLTVPILIFLFAYGLLLHLTRQPGAPPSNPGHTLESVAHLFFRSVGLLFAMFALEEALRPLALRARAGGFKGNRMAFMLGLSYQMVPVFLQSLEGVSLAQRAGSSLWWLRSSGLTRAASSVFLLSHRLSEEMALALSLRLGPSEKRWLRNPTEVSRPGRDPAPTAEGEIEA